MNDKSKICSTEDSKKSGFAFDETIIRSSSIGLQSISGIESMSGSSLIENFNPNQSKFILGRYRVERQIGEGSFGRVFLARDEKLDRLVAIKVAKKSFKEQERWEIFFEEARILAGLDHPHIVPVYDAGNTDNDDVFFISKFIDGYSLADKVKLVRFSLQESISLIISVAEALGHAHEKGLVHRDIKPDNILVDQTGKPHVADFGLALKVSFSIGDSDLNGTPAYMSPEQAQGNQIDCRSDVFSMGVVFYELITGKRLFTGGSLAEIVEKVTKAEISPPSRINSEVPSEVDRICLKALSKNREDRYATAREFSVDLKSYCDSQIKSDAPKNVGLNRRWIGVFLVAVIILLSFSVWLIHRGNEKDLDGKAKAVVSGVLFAEGKALLKALEKSDEFISRTSSIYHQELEMMDKTDPRRVNAILGLRGQDPQLNIELCDHMLNAKVSNLLVIIKRLEPFKKPLVDIVLDKIKVVDSDGLLRIAGALAIWDPDNSGLVDYLPKICEKLIAENKLLLSDWIEVYRPLGDKLYPLLLPKIARKENVASERYFATALCSEFVRNDCSKLFDLMLACEPQNAILIMEKMLPLKNEMLQIVRKTRSESYLAAGFEQDLRFQDRQGVAAAIQISLGDDSGFSVFSSDLTAKSKCMLMLGCLNVAPSRIMDQIKKTSDIASKRSLVIALGDLSLESVDAKIRNDWSGMFLDMYLNNPDSGLHGALDWLLRKRWGLEKECDRIIEVLKSKPNIEKKWFVNSMGQTFVVVGGPVRYTMGSPYDEPLRYDSEEYHPRYISKSIAVGQKEVTINEFLALIPEQRYIEKYAKTPDTAMCCISWYDCARYCNLLTEKEFSKEDCVYLPNEEGLYDQGMKIVDEPLKKKGYRMPTEAEFEFFHRGGSTKAFYHGSDYRLLDRYGFFAGNSQNQLWPVGTLRPNDFGLFDTGGNAFEWCLDIYEGYYDLKGEDEDFFMQLQDRNISSNISRCLRSGCFYSEISAVRSADRHNAKPDDRSNSRGLRLVRSLLP